MIDRVALESAVKRFAEIGETLDGLADETNLTSIYTDRWGILDRWKYKLNTEPDSANQIGKGVFFWLLGNRISCERRLLRRQRAGSPLPHCAALFTFPTRGIKKTRGAFIARSQEDMRELVEERRRSVEEDKRREAEVVARRERKALRRARRDAHRAHVASLRKEIAIQSPTQGVKP